MLCAATVTCVSLTGDGQCVLVSTLANCLYLIDKTTGELLNEYADILFMHESSYCFQLVLAIAILSVRPSVTWVDQSKTMQARITNSSPSAAWKTLVSGTVKLFHKFEGGYPERGR